MTVFVGIGSNLDDPQRQVRGAVRELAKLDETRLIAVSRLYRSAPMGPPDQPEYINAVAKLTTSLQPEALLDALQTVESLHGRVRSGTRWGPRTLDLDILMYGDMRLHTARLRVPHPGIAERNFVLRPLAELAPGLNIPGVGNVLSLLQLCPSGGIAPVEEP